MSLSTYSCCSLLVNECVTLWLLLSSYFLIQPWTELCCRQCKRKDSEKSQCHVMTFFFSTLKTEKRKVIRIQFVSENGFRMCIFIACHGIFCNLARVQTQNDNTHYKSCFSDCAIPPLLRLWSHLIVYSYVRTENWASSQLSKSVKCIDMFLIYIERILLKADSRRSDFFASLYFF